MKIKQDVQFFSSTLTEKEVQHYVLLIFKIWIITDALTSQVLEVSQRKSGSLKQGKWLTIGSSGVTLTLTSW